MFTKKFFGAFLPLVISGLASSATVFAQNNLTAKANAIQPQPVSPVVESDRVRDGLNGPVRRVRTEVAKLSNGSGQPTEEKRVLLEVAAYDIKGAKTENQYFPVAGSTLTGKEVYKYDDKGNISEMTLLNSDGSLLSKEVYKYEYDGVGNWTKMTTSVAVMEGGKVTFEPSEVTYRSITYYLDENMMKMAQPAQPSSQPPAEPTTTKASNANVTKRTGSSSLSKAIDVQLTNRKPVATAPASTAAVEQPKETKGTPGGVTTSGEKPIVALSSEAPPAPLASSSETSISPQPKPLLKPVSGGVLNGKAISLPSPAYPDLAKRMRTTGIVTVEVVLDENGKVISAEATSGPPTLRDAAVQAAMRARFSPTKLSGQPVKVTGQINYKFALQ